MLEAKDLGTVQRALAREVGVSASELSKYEHDLKTPSDSRLWKLSEDLGVRCEFFHRGKILDFNRTEHGNRSRWKVPKRTEYRIMWHAIDQLERWTILERITPSSWTIRPSLPEDLSTSVRRISDIEAVGLRLRKLWNLGLDSIANVAHTLESNGIKVVTAKVTDNCFDGLCGMAGDQPLIVVGTDWPGDRQRFPLAHELCHLVLHECMSSEIDEELACNRIAGSFLVPKLKVKEALGDQRRSLSIYELYLQKHEYGLSIAGWAHRASDLGILSLPECHQLRKTMSECGWNEVEPGAPYPPESSCLFERTVQRALWEDMITESMAAELMGVSHWKFVQRKQMEFSPET